MNLKLTILILISLVLLQLGYGFLFPSCGFNDNWQPISTYLPKFTVESSDNLLLSKIYPLISSEYRLNSDTGHYLELARDFSPREFDGSPFLERPLYPFLISLFSQFTQFVVPTSYGVIFALAILVNLILMSVAVVLFFFLLKKVFSEKVAWLSSILLIFSPFVHSFLNQPLAEILMVFSVVTTAFLLQNYIARPSFTKLVVFSLIVGAFLLGKMFFATSFFILLLALYFRRYREGTVFLAVHLMPFFLWYLFVTQVWQIGYYSHGVQHWHMGIWVLNILYWPWQETYRVLLGTVPSFLTGLLKSFILVPVIFSVMGFSKLPFKAKNIFYFGSLLAVFLLGFLTKFYYLRHVFLLFPIIYPTAVLGMEAVARRLGRYQPFLKPLFYATIISLMIIISNINIYRVFDYNNY